jgi:prepilin-type N-terminal cleavage/methylation domain-containing protein
MEQNIKKGFTLMESLIALTITGGAVGMVISNSAEQNEKEAGMKLIQEMNQVINAIDHRIAIDGYNPDSWGGKYKWKNIEEVSKDLISEQLNSTESKCPGGKWEPSMESEENTQLLPCNLWSGLTNRIGGDIFAEMNIDSVGYIQGFDLYFQFKEEKDFSKYFQGLKKGMKYFEIKDKRELSGSHFISFVNKSNKDDFITTTECIGLQEDCLVKATFDRSGGNEYIRADGTNSMIASHLTFIEAKEEKDPLKCIRWENTSVNNIDAWTSEEVDCGIGIYNKDNKPVLVDTVTDSGTFNSVILDKECKVLKWNETSKKVEDTGKVSACGIFKNKDDLDGGTLSEFAVYQVVDNVVAEEGTFNILNAAIGNIESITADTINTSVLEVMNELNVNGKSEFQGLVNIDSDLTVTGRTTTQDLTVIGNTNVKDLTATGDTNVNNLTSTGTTNLNNVTINDLEVTGETKLNTVNITGDLIVDGSIEGEFGDLNQKFTQIESIIEDINGRVTNNESNIHTNASNISKLEKRVEVNEKNIEILFNELNSAQPPEPDIKLVQKWVKVDKRTDTGGCTNYGTKPAGDECAIVGERVYTKKVVGTQGNYCKLEVQYWSCQLVEVKVD